MGLELEEEWEEDKAVVAVTKVEHLDLVDIVFVQNAKLKYHIAKV